ncbi:MAG: dipeptidase PepV [Firmicutes bacterium]|nr:dipeptidase PepV [Bacillota bacterium]
MKEVEKTYQTYLEKNEEEMIKALQELIRCKSEEGEPVERDGVLLPFGEGVQEALEKTLELGRNLGFETCNVDNYGAHIDWVGTGRPILDEEGQTVGHEKPQIMAIIGHLDVVPAGSDWDFDPYGGEVKDGKIYGRGTTDDKGPVVSCLFAMKALKDGGYQPVNTVRIILGLDEETKWKGMNYYFTKAERPDYGFTPDADFPIINGEKGLLIFELARKFGTGQKGNGLQLRSIKGGTAPNSVADSCRTVVRSDVKGAYDEIRKKAEAYKEKSGYKIGIRGMGKSLELTTAGISAHGAKPEAGLNAISIMMEFLGELNFVNEDHNDFIAFYNRHIGFYLNGEGLGVNFADEKSGKLVFNVGMIELTPKAGKLTINIRYPISSSDTAIFTAMEPALNQYQLGLIKTEHRAPIYMELDDPMVKTLLEIYQSHTGDQESKPLVIGGGTYARCTPGIIAYGALFPGDEDLMHQKNECMELSRFRLMTKIYAEAIYKLSAGGYNN